MKRKYSKYKISFITLSIVLITLFVFIPLIYGIYLSFFSGRGSEMEFAGLENYIRIFSDSSVGKAIVNTLIFLILTIILVLFFSTLLSYAIDKIKNKKIKSICTTILFFPSITSPIAYSFFFKKLFEINGFLNNILINLNIISEPQNYLLTPWGARLAVVFVCLWSFTGYFTILMVSARQSVNPDIYKMARVDGANGFQMLYKVHIPMLKPIIIFSSILISCSMLQLFAEVSIITQGGPHEATLTFMTYIYSLCFKYVPQFGYASSIGVVLFMLCSLICFTQYKLENKNEKI